MEGGFTPLGDMADLQHALTCQEYKQAELVNNKAERDIQLSTTPDCDKAGGH